jgi:hypothetical protein
MTLFLSESNQTMLWELINKNQLFISLFGTSPQHLKQEWFKTSISAMYDSIQGAELQKKELLDVNRRTLKMMIQRLQDMTISQNQRTVSNEYYKKEKINMNEFETKQQEYNSMLELKKPEEIKFSETIDDEKITNMAELIENQRRLRELDYQNSVAVNEPKVNILQDISTNELDPIRVSKSVTFDLPGSPIDNHNTKIMEILMRLDENVARLDENVARLDEKISKLMETPEISKLIETPEISKRMDTPEK